jgi:hypothetical protein
MILAPINADSHTRNPFLIRVWCQTVLPKLRSGEENLLFAYSGSTKKRPSCNFQEAAGCGVVSEMKEFERWWPINIAELRFLQREICQELGYRPGRITTVAADARTISRSPIQVAMPIVDRWLDQAPERLHTRGMGLPDASITPRRKRLAAAASRLTVSRKSIVCPVESSARYRYLSSPLTFI